MANSSFSKDGDRKTSDELLSLLKLAWSNGYKSEVLQADIYEDVISLVKLLTCGEVKLYSYSKLPSDLQKLFLVNSNQGDLTEYFADHLVASNDKDNNNVNLSEKLKSLVEGSLKRTLAEVLYLTQSYDAAKTANELGMKSCFVLRNDGDDVTEEQLQTG
ncbi:hypothetical protein HELRODRAFT_195157 [Helobdella robusta]|uniref:Uncharacterized protein n=1 Tax=Helobdella robusta TaxID=6412 RepID=T1FWT7_HELRO|nr:hypothetical protein HELRODRAFT_195157 [Helobdella robusta]ESO02732.1 hypothetical protein HELRODRAFT_195157 [Helobdella robusta]